MSSKISGVYLAASLIVLSLAIQTAQAQNRRTSDTQQPAASSDLGNYRNERADQWVPLEMEKRQAINTDLQATVVELLELFHDAKQSHWNVRGPLYFPLHEALQEYADMYLAQADLLAERQLQIGLPADGRPETIVQTANLPKFPAGFLSDRQML